MNNNIQLCRLAIFTIGAVVSIYSGSLTYTYMRDLSPTLGNLGALMELIKFFLPMLALYAVQQGARIRAVLLSIITVLLVLMSFTASFVAVDTGFKSERKDSEQFKSLTWQIEASQSQILAINSQIEKLPRNYYQKRSDLSQQVRDIKHSVSQLMDKRASLVTNSIGDQFGRYIAFGSALIIELLTIATAIALSLFKPHSDAQSHTDAVCVTNTDKDIKGAIIAGDISPSHRGISERFSGVSRESINMILNELFECGVLKRYRRGFALV